MPETPFLIAAFFLLSALIVGVFVFVRHSRKSALKGTITPVSIQLMPPQNLMKMLTAADSLQPGVPPELLVVDARSLMCHGMLRIQRSINIPPAVPGCPDTEAEVITRIKYLPLDKILIFFDQSGANNGEAMCLARQVLNINLGFKAKNINVLEGGLTAWTGLDYSLEIPEPW